MELQTRTEHSRSLEEAEKYQALHTLTELGVLIPLADLDASHGRVARSSDEEWSVDPAFRNGSNDSGHNNINSRPTLYTSDRDTAQKFADTRIEETVRGRMLDDLEEHAGEQDPVAWRERQLQKAKRQYENMSDELKKIIKAPADSVTDTGPWKPVELRRAALEHVSEASSTAKQFWRKRSQEVAVQIHQINSADSEARVIDATFDPQSLNPDQKEKYFDALSALKLTGSQGSPVEFGQGTEVRRIGEALGPVGSVTTDQAAEVSTQEGIDAAVVMQVVGAHNARWLLGRGGLRYLADRLVSSPKDLVSIPVRTGDGDTEDIPVNLEYVRRLFREAHIVGMQHIAQSGTLGHEEIAMVSLFDLEKVNTDTALEANRARMVQEFGALAHKLSGVNYEGYQRSELLHALTEDPHIEPSRLVELAMNTEGYKAVFEADAGNWEGYTLAEHIETVLRNFDENFADELPVELLAPLRLALVAHDIGKPLAAKHDQIHRQKEYNQTYAADFFANAGLDAAASEFLTTMIGDGMELAYRSSIRGDGTALDRLRSLAREQVTLMWGDSDPSDELINGYVAACRILFICDGGAYTSMAVTRRGRSFSRNAPTFNDSFAPPLDPGARALHLRRAGSPSAPERHFVAKSD